MWSIEINLKEIKWTFIKCVNMCSDWLWLRCDAQQFLLDVGRQTHNVLVLHMSTVSVLKHISSLEHDEHLHQSYLAVKFPRDLSTALLCVKLPSRPCVVINIKANALTCFPEQLSVYIEVCISPGTRSLKILHTWMTTGTQRQGFFHRPAHANPCPSIFMNSGKQEHRSSHLTKV